MPLEQYRYLLVVGRMVRDGGRAVDVFLPGNALRLHDGKATLLADDKTPRYTHGVVAEVLLSGRHVRGEKGEPLADAPNLAALLRQLLPSPQDGNTLAQQDALGMIRRFSPISEIDFHAA